MVETIFDWCSARSAWSAPKTWGASAEDGNGAASGVVTDRFRKDEGQEYGNPDAENSDFKTASGQYGCEVCRHELTGCCR